MRLTGMLMALLARFRPSKEIQREATALVAKHGPQGAWIVARDKRRLAQVVDAQDDARRWNAMMREIERQTGYMHQPDTATRMAERNLPEDERGQVDRKHMARISACAGFVRVVMAALACGLAGNAHAELLSPLRIVQWETPIAEFRPESIGSLLRSLDLNETVAIPLPRYLEFRHDLVRITAASGSAWYLIPLSPDIPYPMEAD